VVFTGHKDDDYIAQVDIALNSGLDGALYVRYLDPDNWYRVRCEFPAGAFNPTAKLEKMLHGELSVLASATYTNDTWATVKIALSGSTITVDVEGSQVITHTDADIPWGAVALSGWQAKFAALDVRYASGDVVINDDFGGTTITPTYDANGNMTKDADYAYADHANACDAWDNLVSVKAQNDADVTVATYKFFADDRRAKEQLSTTYHSLSSVVSYGVRDRNGGRCKVILTEVRAVRAVGASPRTVRLRACLVCEVGVLVRHAHSGL
jgi:hypothetical protein